MSSFSSLNFNFGKVFNGEAAEWVEWSTQCLSTAVTNDLGDGALRYHFSTVDQWLTHLANHPGLEVDYDHDDYDMPPVLLDEDDDPDRFERQQGRLAACRTAFERSLGPKVMRKLKERAGGGAIHDLSMRQMMNIIRESFAVLSAAEIKKIQEPIKTPYQAHSTQTIEEYVDSHIDVHNTIEFFLPAHPLEQKIQFLIEGVAVCGLFALAVQFANNRQTEHARFNAAMAAARRRPFTFVEWTEAFVENVPACNAMKTTGNSGFAGSVAAVGPAGLSPIPSSLVSAEDLAAYHRVQMAFAAVGGHNDTCWCYLHGTNGSHHSSQCRSKDLIPADKMKATAANPMGGPDRSLLRRKKQKKSSN